MGGARMEEGEEEGRATERVRAVAELFGIAAWGRVALKHLHWLSRMEASHFHSAQVLGIGRNR